MSKYFINKDGKISKFDDLTNDQYIFPIETVCGLLNKSDESYDKLANKFAIVCKALELACGDIYKHYFDSNRKDEIILDMIVDYKNKAEEVLYAQDRTED